WRSAGVGGYGVVFLLPALPSHHGPQIWQVRSVRQNERGMNCEAPGCPREGTQRVWFTKKIGLNDRAYWACDSHADEWIRQWRLVRPATDEDVERDKIRGAMQANRRTVDVPYACTCAAYPFAHIHGEAEKARFWRDWRRAKCVTWVQLRSLIARIHGGQRTGAFGYAGAGRCGAEVQIRECASLGVGAQAADRRGYAPSHGVSGRGRTGLGLPGRADSSLRYRLRALSRQNGVPSSVSRIQNGRRVRWVALRDDAGQGRLLAKPAGGLGAGDANHSRHQDGQQPRTLVADTDRRLRDWAQQWRNSSPTRRPVAEEERCGCVHVCSAALPLEAEVPEVNASGPPESRDRAASKRQSKLADEAAQVKCVHRRSVSCSLDTLSTYLSQIRAWSI